MQFGRSRLVGALALCAAFLLVVVVAGCGKTGEADPAKDPVSSVEALLSLRYDRSTDASEYAKYLAAPELAIELAKASEEESKSTTPPTPEWEKPYASVSATSSAEVVVIWKPSEEVEGFPPATVFSLTKIGDAWKSTDAVAVETTAEIPARKK